MPKRSRARRRLDAFNRLLRDVYGRSVWFSHLLIKHGVSQAEIEDWRQDGRWLVLFLRRLEKRLSTLLTQAVPGKDPQVLIWWYGLDGCGAQKVDVIADKLDIACYQVRAAKLISLKYLRGKEGQACLERAVVKAAAEAESKYRALRASYSNS